MSSLSIHLNQHGSSNSNRTFWSTLDGGQLPVGLFFSFASGDALGLAGLRSGRESKVGGPHEMRPLRLGQSSPPHRIRDRGAATPAGALDMAPWDGATDTGKDNDGFPRVARTDCGAGDGHSRHGYFLVSSILIQKWGILKEGGGS